MKLTDEQIKEKAYQYSIIKHANYSPQTNMELYLINFAKSLFKETEEETWKKVVEQDKCAGTHMSNFHLAEFYHKERTRIENE